MSLYNRGSLLPYMADEIEYYPHQAEGVRILAGLNSWLLADEMGLGKTLQTITVFTCDVLMDKGHSMIVVCPASLKENWHAEIKAFTTFHSEVLVGGPKARREQLTEFHRMTGPKILIVNYEQVVSHVKTFNAMRFYSAAFDEAHMMKNPKSKRTKACLELRTARSFLLTGSPLLNHVNELWTLLEKISPGAYGGYWNFVSRYCRFGGYQDKQIVGVKNEKELNMILGQVMLRRLKKDVLDLPAVQYITRMVGLHPSQKKLYDEVMNELKLTVSEADGAVDVQNALTKFLRLKQICGTTATVMRDDTGAYTSDDSMKLDLAAEDAGIILDSGRRVLSFTQFRGVQEAFVDRMKRAKYPVYILNGDVPIDRRQQIVNAWSNSSKPGILIAIYSVAGVGLNMTAASFGQRLDKLFVPELNAQAVARMDRIGQKETVQIFDYLCVGTVEDRVEKIVRDKKKIFNNIVEESKFSAALVQALLEED